MNLINYGWNNFFENYSKENINPDQIPGRIIRENRGNYKIATESGIIDGEISGKMHYGITSKIDFPVVGDWVILSKVQGESKALIHDIFPRKTVFSRKEAGRSYDKQLLAVNMDAIFIITSLNQNFNLRRIERYMILAWDSGATPVLILSKADLESNINAKICRVESVSNGARVIAISAKTGFGMDSLMEYLKPGNTIALFGSSGVGKSTLINHLTGTDFLKTNEIRESDGEGRHTTSWRELIILPCGAMIMDTPGLREIGLTSGSADINDVFNDIAIIALECKFKDCSHTREPGCAVNEALESGKMERGHYINYLKLQKENNYFDNKDNISAKIKEKKRRKNISKLAKKFRKKGLYE